VLKKERANILIELVSPIEQPLENFYAKVFAYLEDVHVFTNHLAKDGEVCAAGGVLFQEVLED
jgi:hypothetical protein